MQLSKFIFQSLLGWSIVGQFDKSILKTVVIVLPHTSWHDFYVGAFTRKIIKVPINYVAKKELFDSPFGWYFKWMGGEPIERKSKQNKVEQIVKLFNSKNEFRLAIAPEGTRKKVKEWKSGFYYIAHESKVPITSVAFDYSTKTVKISEPFYTTGDYKKDVNELKKFFTGVVGKIPAYT
ncbi:1-acyl-sn-glycerol-3-phosphate acyltransferase [Psychroflexus montanilacus]|uniref:1-acyl-sn-glycerol-3-phosphate acyltransferase n=1 Tax=Psychroflexus montanilacus TaxID=2873598 RepID=UPI001CCE0AC7|nr:1-acyl-sn-glycerol-3-phosphate acyltransferase [Psychroflexus montanilacus]MBZ9652723.1 1-acyl-sn-glycerol-3-phosphate acyltransferase [Psychroflexus montanilacus]